MEDLSRYYTLLRDPKRRRIIEILGTQEKIGFKELRHALGLGVGTVYYHLDMLSDFIEQDKERKYRLNDRGRALYKVLKEGHVPASLEISEAFAHRFARWLFLSPVFAKTVKPLRYLPIALAILFLGAFGSAYAKLEPTLFFYWRYPDYTFSSIVMLYVVDWVGLFLFAEIFANLLYRRAGNDLQLFVCVAVASFPMAVFPYLYLFMSDIIAQYVQIGLQVWSLLLVSAAFCFGKGIRLDRGIVLSLAAMYLNIAILFIQGRFA